ncbi:MAG TPA: FAD-dependent monooxygenase [Pseudonocardiaceae bacterium]
MGGGVAGPALALFLAKIGVAAKVFEAYPYTAGVGGGFNIAPNGMHVLAALGVADELSRAATSTPVSYFRDGKGRLLGTVPYGVATVYGQPAVDEPGAAVSGAGRTAEEPGRAGRLREGGWRGSRSRRAGWWRISPTAPASAAAI